MRKILQHANLCIYREWMDSRWKLCKIPHIQFDMNSKCLWEVYTRSLELRQELYTNSSVINFPLIVNYKYIGD